MRINSSLVLCALLAVPLSHGAVTEPPLFHVSTNGHDAWSGRLQEPNASRTDGPLPSMVGARDAVRRARAAGGLEGPITVRVHGGTYRMREPLVLEPQDSGRAGAPLVIEAAPGEQPVMSGGRVIGGFRQRGPLWETVVPEVKADGWYFRQLFVNGQRRQRARSPNQGFYRIASPLPGPKDAQGKAVARDRFAFVPGDLKPWARMEDVNLVLMHSWETSIHPLKSVDPNSNIVEFAAPLREWWCIGYWEKAQRYYVENALELLDTPGEWYLDRATGVLSYWPMPGEELGQVEVVAPRLTELLRLAGNADTGRHVQHVLLRGLAWHHADWVLDPKGNSSTQAAVETPAALTADGAQECAIERCEVAHVGTYGIWFRRGCKECRIERTRVFDLGAGGVRLGEANMARTDAAESSKNVVDNNHIYAGGHIYPGCVGIWVAQSSGNRISHNDIHDLYYTGISVGWNWGLEPNRTTNNLIEFNHVHDLGHGVMSDAGLIYCLGSSPGSIIRNNVFHDLWPYSQPALGWGIYLDAQCGNYLVESNLVYNTLSGGLMFNNGGHEHVIRNNIFALSAHHALWPYSEKRPNTFCDNIVFLTQGQLLIPLGERSLQDRLNAGESPGQWDHNLYWHTGGASQLRFYRRTFEEWQRLGLDQDSRIADPQFVNAAEHDFRLERGSPAFDLGFREFEIGKAGLYGDADWVKEASHARCPRIPLPVPPAPPKPLEVDDGFETTPMGSPPEKAGVSGEEQGASIRISGEHAAAGQRSLKVTDSATLQPAWQPHFYYEPHILSGTVRQSFDVWFETNAQFFTEWRDNSAYPQNLGPSVRFEGNGSVRAGNQLLATVPSRHWVHVEIQAPLGKTAPRVFQVTLTPEGEQPKVFSDLPMSGRQFGELHWLGFSSTALADTVFYLDNVKVKSTTGQRP